jgi:hypothetical protein
MDRSVRSSSRAILAAASVAFALLGYAIGSHEPASSAAPVGHPIAEAAQTAPTKRVMNAPSAARSAPRVRYAELAERADDGDREAAAALAERLRPCAMRAMLDNEALHLDAMLDPDSPSRSHFAKNPKSLEAFEKQAAISQASAREADDACVEMTPEQVLARGHWLYRAAELGDAKSALEFGRGDFLRFEPLTHLDEVAFWREHSEAMLERAVAGGERDALIFLAAGHDVKDERWFDGPRFDPDPVAAYAYYTALSLSSDRIDVQVEGALDRLDRELSDTDRTRAREQAAELCVNHPALGCDPGAPPMH